MLAFVQCAFTQEIGVALAGLSNFDNSLGDDSLLSRWIRRRRSWPRGMVYLISVDGEWASSV
jgi:hypothetical protein